jgi:hyaluronate lyase
MQIPLMWYFVSAPIWLRFVVPLAFHAEPVMAPKPRARLTRACSGVPGRISPLPILLALVVLLPGSAAGDAFDDLRLQWRDFMTGGTNLNLAEPAIASKVSSVGSTAQNRWNAMNKSAGRTYLWSDAASTTVSADLVTSYNRLREMALGWATVGSSVYSNASLAADIVGGLGWMYTNRYNEGSTLYDNWWSWEIGVPHALNDCMVLMYPVLTAAQITNYCKPIDKFTPQVSPGYFGWTMTGANRIWKAQAAAVRAVVGKNGPKLTAARDGLSDAAGGGTHNIFKYVTSGDGFYTDGSFIQHGRHPYTGGYGLYLFRDAVPMLVWLDGSPWAVTDPQRNNVVNWAFDSFEPLLYRGALVEHVRGREISRNYSGFSVGRSAINAMLRLAQTSPPAEAARLKGIIKHMHQTDTTSALTNYVDIDLVGPALQLLGDTNVVARGELIGHVQFPAMDRVMHLRPGFAFGLSLSSARIYNYESINGENYKGWFTSDGMTYLMNGELTQFTDAFWPTVDPYRLPGTTVDLTARANGSGSDYLSPQGWAGGASLGQFGAAGMALKAFGNSLVANKSWFMFDNEIVCLGAGISSSGATNVITTIENRRLNSSGNNAFTADGAAMPTSLGWTFNFNSLTWCALSNAGGYFFPRGAAVRAQRAARSGSWSDINAGGSSSSITRNYFWLGFDHGIAPSNATYSYVLLPNLASDQVAAYAANPDIEIVENSTQAQAVREKALGILAANFWNAAPKTVDFITCSNRASVLVQETLDELIVAVSDPTQTNSSAVGMTLNRSALNVASLDTGITVLQLSPVIRLTVNMANRRGQAATARFITYSNSPPVLAALASQVIEVGQTLGATAMGQDTGALPQRLRYALTAAPAGASIDATSGGITWQPDATFANTSNLFTVLASEAGWETNLTAQADTFVRSGFANNYGAESALDVRLAGATTTREAYMRFAIPDLRGTVSEAKLELTPTTLAHPALVHAAARANSDAWDEASMTWSNRPGYGPLLGTWQPRTEPGVDVTGPAHTAELGGGVVSFAVVATNDPAGNVLAYWARESDPALAPRLRVITTNDIALSATQCFWVSVLPSNQPPVMLPITNASVAAGSVFAEAVSAWDPDAPPRRLTFRLLAAPDGATIDPNGGAILWTPGADRIGTSNLFVVEVLEAGWETNRLAEADTFVRSGFASNYGTNSALEIRQAGGTTTREAYLRFALPPLPGGLRSATLVLTPTAEAHAALVHAVARANSDAWNEMTMTWNDRPGYGPLLATWQPRHAAVADVSALAGTAAAGTGLLSLAVVATNDPAANVLSYWSREGGDPGTAPRLSVIYTNGFERAAVQTFWVTVEPVPPLAAPTISAPSLADGQFTFVVSGESASSYSIQVSTNLADWETVFSTNAPALPFLWNGPALAAGPHWFYRVLVSHLAPNR